MQDGPEIDEVKIFGAHACWERFHICAGKQQVFCLRIDPAKLLARAGRTAPGDRCKDPGNQPLTAGDRATGAAREERTLAPSASARRQGDGGDKIGSGRLMLSTSHLSVGSIRHAPGARTHIHPDDL